MNMNKYSLRKSFLIISEWVSRENKFCIIRLAFFSIFVGLLEVSSLISIRPILNVFNNKNNIESNLIFGSNTDNLLLLLVLAYAFMICFISFLKIKTISYGNFLSAKIGQEIGKNLLTNYLGQDYKMILNRDSSVVINTFISHLNQSVGFITFFLQISVSFLCTICIVIFITFENPLATFGTFVSVSFSYFLIANKIKLKNVNAAQTVKISLDQITKLIQEVTSDIEKSILGYRDNETINKFAMSDRALRISTARGNNYTMIPRYIVEVIAISSFLILTMISALFLNQDNITLITKLSISIFGLQKILPSVNTIYQSWNRMNYLIPSVYTVKDLMSEYFDRSRIQDGNKKVNDFKKSIVISNLEFGYKKDKLIIKDFNLEIKKGEKILIKGKSGLGKSTLIKIICSLIKPTKGEIIIDNKCLGKEIKISNWRRQIGLVKQKPYLKSGKLINLILGKEIKVHSKNDFKKAKYYAELACIDKFIESLPNGYMQEIKDEGNNLSGGQIQRIAIAISLALQPSLLILDESTSGVDKITESKIFENVMKFEKLTIIAISHSSNVEKLFSKKIDL